MIIKLQRVISCSSEHPDFPASNLLKNPPPGPWKCEKPGVLLINAIFQLSEECCITGLDIGNYRSCIVIVTASTTTEPDDWVPVVNHQFLTHDEAANNKFRDQVQLFTKRELNADTIKIKFSRVKITCMQSANLKELFGLSFLVLRTEVVIDMNIDVFGRFKLKTEDSEKSKFAFKEKYLRLFPNQKKDYKEEIKDKIKENGVASFNKRQEESREPRKRPLLEKLEAGRADEVFGKKSEDEETKEVKQNDESKEVKRTPFGDIIPESKRTPNGKPKAHDRPSTSRKRPSISSDGEDEAKKEKKAEEKKQSKKLNTSKNPSTSDANEEASKTCSVCTDQLQDRPCQKCGKLPKQKPMKSPQPKKQKVDKPKKEFSKLLDDVTFSLSGYVNPQRDEIRRKALKMGARYIADPNTTTNKCTHLICAFRNTPKSQQLKGHAKIVSHVFVEECFDHKKRYPWRRYALEKADRKQPESEDEVEGTDSPITQNLYEQDTDPDSDTDY